MAVTTSNSAYILKTLWPQKRVENTVYKDHAFLAMVPKNEEFYGDSMVLAVRFADTQGRSATFSTAQANKGNHQGKKFILTRVKDYQLVSLETEAILASKNDRGALIRNLDTEMDSGMNNIGKSLATALYRTGTGSIGQSASTASPITLVNINDITSFEVGMVITASQTDGGALRAGSGTITAIDRDAGTITYSGTITSLTANDYLYAQGDEAAAGSNLKVAGLLAWLPSTAPATGGSDSFFSVDRSSDVTRLAGLRVDATGLNPEEACVTALSKLSREGGRPDHLFVNHLDFRNIEISIGSKLVYKPMSVGEIGFTGLELIGPRGPVMVVPDQDCPSGRGFALQMDTWKFYSLEKAPQVLDLDGNRLSREPTADRWEARIVYFGNLGCVAPGYNANIAMPT